MTEAPEYGVVFLPIRPASQVSVFPLRILKLSGAERKSNNKFGKQVCQQSDLYIWNDRLFDIQIRTALSYRKIKSLYERGVNYGEIF